MKKIILILIAVASGASTIHAQETKAADTRKAFQLGIKAGANYSNVYDAQGQAFVADAKFGFAAGGFISIPLGKYIGIQPEVLFSQKGFQGSGVILGSPYSFTRTTSYIDIPVLFAIKPVNSLTLLIGPQYAYLTNQKDVFTSAIVNGAQEQEFKNDNVRKNILSVLGGVDFTQDHFVFGVRAGWDIQSNNGDGTSTTPRYKNQWLQATVGFAF